jgi:2-C-methyl-D-erythritol 4-phosphate cytidylyltransferase
MPVLVPALMPADLYALVPAAGSGSRFGGSLPKQYSRLQGKTVLEHTLAALLQLPLAGCVVVVSPTDVHWQGVLQSLPESQRQRIHTVLGGDNRAQSVLNGLLTLPEPATVLVHDAARPLLPLDAVQRLILEANDDHGGLLAVPVADTLKRESHGRSADTVDRSRLWRAQTPQYFKVGLLKKALQTLDLSQITDEASAMEAYGYQPKLVRGHERNFKITYPEDLALAELYLCKAT